MLPVAVWLKYENNIPFNQTVYATQTEPGNSQEFNLTVCTTKLWAHSEHTYIFNDDNILSSLLSSSSHVYAQHQRINNMENCITASLC